MDFESTNAQDARIEDLFRALDAKQRGYLDINSLRAGLKNIDHPLKNASSLIEKILHVIDADHDDRISFNEFKIFMKHTERELYDLFQAIDLNHDGSLDRAELQLAFRKAGLSVSRAKLNHFFDAIDSNQDGNVSFEEWRNFLLFLPDSQNLEAVLSYYNSTSVSINSEGDVHVSNPFSSSTENSQLSSASGDFLMQSPAMLQPMPTAAEVAVLPNLDWTKWENMKPILIACVPSSGYFAAGAIAGIASRTATAPIDRLKVYLIAQTKKSEISSMKSNSPLKLLHHAYRTTAFAFAELWKAGGLRSLYAGNGINIIKVVPESAIKFGCFEAMKRVTAKTEGHNNPKRISNTSKIISGGTAGVMSQLVVYPLDTLKFRMQCETVAGGAHGNRLILLTAHKMWVKEGIRSFYRGFGAGLIGMAPYAAIDLGTFEYLKNYVTEHNVKKYDLHEDDARPNSALTAAMGGFTGTLGATVVYPINLIRTRLQSQGTILHPRTYDGFWDCARVTWHGEGFRGLFKGLLPNIVKVAPAVSITYVVYENCKKSWDLK